MPKAEHLDIELDPEDIILLLLDAHKRVLGKNAINGITRLEKLLFLVKEEADFEGIARFFSFEPDKFGPFSKEVYEATEFLEGCELIDIGEKSYSSLYANTNEAKLWSEIMDSGVPEDSGSVTEKVFALTDDGRKVADKLRQAVAARRPKDIKELDRIVLQYGPRPLNHLIRYVYHQYPAMTAKSIHPEAKNVRKDS